MEVIIKGLIFEVGGTALLVREVLNISEHPCMYNKKYIIEKILEAQNNNTLTREYISSEMWEYGMSHLTQEEIDINYGLIDMQSLTFCDDTLSLWKGDDVCMTDMLEIHIKPGTKEEINIYFEQYLKKQYNVLPEDADSFNAVLILPNSYLLRGYGIIAAGDYMTADAFTKYDRSSDTYTEYSYVIHKSALQYPILNINAPKPLIPHLIGKGGKQITAFKNRLKEYTGSNVRRINIVPFMNEG